MKKRIVCVLLTLIMLVSLVPATALTASAATMKTSEAAITVLKQMEGYTTSCGGKGSTFGYGTVCTEEEAHTSHNEKEADVALRSELEALDKAVNSFAGKKGLALSQNKHDALVLFSFENGTAWTTGTGDFQSAIVGGVSGTEFLNAICRWDTDTSDDLRRMVEANMYLNGVYSSSRPSQFIRVKYELNGGSEIVCAFDENGDPMVDENGELVMQEVAEATYMAQSAYQYYDLTKTAKINLTPSNPYHYFLGWYTDASAGTQVTSLKAGHHGATLYAHWQAIGEDAGTINTCYEIAVKNLASDVVYAYPNGKETKMALGTHVWIGSEYVDDNGTRWGGIVEKLSDDEGNTVMGSYILGWVKLKSGSTGTASDENGTIVDVTVTVTNTYINVRGAAGTSQPLVGKVYYGDKLHITRVDTSSNGSLWGKCEKGWIALMYTDYASVAPQDNTNNSTAIATAVVTINGYVNVRSGAGTDNQIVGALANKTEVELYETKFVNGIEWGRCKTGWFCLAYAKVTRLTQDNSYVSDAGYLAYTFTGTINGTIGSYNRKLYATPGDEDSVITTRKALKGAVTVTNLTNVGGITWGKISEGWIKVSDADGNPIDVTLDVAKYYTVVDGVTVRDDHSTSANRVNNLVKGVEFNVNEKYQVVVVGETVWGYADKVGEADKTYSGWINLASKYVSRGDAPAIDVETSTGTGQIATIVGADSVRVRKTHALYGTVLGSISRGTTANILAEKDGWYKLDYDVDGDPTTDSWVFGTYVQVSEGSVNSGSAATGTTGGTASTGETGVGIISNTYGGVNIRSNPGTGSALLGKILPGTQVNILEVRTHGSSKWGRVDKGWICMDYVTIISDLPADILASLNGSSNGASTSTSTSEVAIYTGSAAKDLTIYKTTSLNSEAVRTLKQGDPITMHEIVTVTDKVTTSSTETNTGSTTTTETITSYWARVNDGYIYNPTENLVLDTLDEATYTVTESDTLNVRTAAGTDGTSIEYKLQKGDQVTVTSLKIVKSNVWGFIEADEVMDVTTDEEGNKTVETWDGDGWVSLAYMTKGAVSVASQTAPVTTPTVTEPVIGSTGNTGTGGVVNNTSGYKYTGKVINTNSVNVRATASTTATISTTLKNGTSLVIYETVISEGMAWGRCDAGWVYLYYVDLTPCVNGAVDARVVYNDNTIIYTDMNCSDEAGTYAKMSVIDIYEIVGKMARTELGWVNTDNLL